MSNPKLAHERVQAINNRASAVMAMTVGAIDETLPEAQQIDQLKAVVGRTAMFEGVNPMFGMSVLGAWTESLRNYKARNGHYPNAELLANAHASLETLITESVKPESSMKGNGKAMLESVAADMRTSDGVMRQAQFAAMILPASLGAATSDACTFVPCDRDESDIYELINVAGASFGSFTRGDELNMQSAGVYSQMARNIKFDTQPDGKVKDFTLDISKTLGTPAPIRAGYVKVMVNRRMSKVDDGDGNVYFNDTDFAGVSYQATGKVDYSKGTITLSFADIPAAGTELSARVEINIEANPGLIPVINQSMRKYSVSPSQYVLAAEHTIMSASDLQREFGLNLQSIQFQAMTQWISHEQDTARLRNLVYHTVPAYGAEFDVSLPEGQTYESWVGIMKHAVNGLSTAMMNRTKVSGIRGGFAGGAAANYLRSLPSTVFQLDPNYVQSPYIQVIGKLFGTITIVEVPEAVCNAYQAEGLDFGLSDIYFYGRGEDIGKAGLIAGDAVPAMPYVHPTDKNLINRTTIWGSAINEVHPRNGESYFARLRLTNSKTGAYDMLTGKAISGDAGK